MCEDEDHTLLLISREDNYEILECVDCGQLVTEWN